MTDAFGGRDRPALQRVLDSIRFSGDALLTDAVMGRLAIGDGELSLRPEGSL